MASYSDMGLRAWIGQDNPDDAGGASSDWGGPTWADEPSQEIVSPSPSTIVTEPAEPAPQPAAPVAPAVHTPPAAPAPAAVKPPAAIVPAPAPAPAPAGGVSGIALGVGGAVGLLALYFVFRRRR